MSCGYGTGITHSGEVCDLNPSRVEQRVFAMLAQLLLQPSFWGRLVDDYFLVLEGPIADRLKIIDAMEKADPKRPLKVQTSSQSIDFLDVLTTGILEPNRTPNPATLACTSPTPLTTPSLPLTAYCQGTTTDLSLHPPL